MDLALQANAKWKAMLSLSKKVNFIIDFFYIILRVCGVLTQDDEPPDPAISVSHVIPGSKYTKHLAVWGVYTNGENNIYGVGVLLNDHVVLSHTVINVTERKISASSRKEIHVGFTIVGSYRYPMRIPYSQADKFMDGSLYMKSSRADMPHLGLINIQATLRLHPYYVAPMKLPEHEYNGSKNCIIVGWGNFKDKVNSFYHLILITIMVFTHTDVFETKVQVMDVEACRTATDFPTLHDNCICILSELGDEVCEAAGGEPIICDDKQMPVAPMYRMY
uniref:Peptidase S1 domain-containing protein n=1 Tax=Glossina pallidipes TaxID=7398 RepID=A0A1B0A881_GLOPL